MQSDDDGLKIQICGTRVYIARSIGAAIKEMRTRRGLTQRELAPRLDLPVRYLSTLEQDHATERLERLPLVLAELDARVLIQEGTSW